MAGSTSGAYLVGEFLNAYADDHPEARGDLTERRARIMETLNWVRSLRSAVAARAGYPAGHVAVTRALEAFEDKTRAVLERFGGITLSFGPSEAMTEEGFPIPEPKEGDGYLLFCFYRDGIGRLTILPGVEEEELATLVEVVSQNGIREGDDAVTWLWSGRFRHLRIELDPAFSPRIARAQLEAGGDDPVLKAYVTVLQTAGPAMRGSERREPIARQHAGSLSNLGITPERLQQMLGTAGRLTEPGLGVSEPDRENFFQRFIDDQDRELRRARIRRLSGGGSG